MFKLCLTTVCALATLSGVARAEPVHQFGPGSTISFQGELVVTAVSTACAASQDYAGDSYTMVYRHKVASTDPADTITLYSHRSSFLMASTASTGSLNGATATVEAVITHHTELYTGLSGTSNLGISTFGGTPIESTNNIKIVGTIDNFYTDQGCTATIRSGLTREAD